MLNRYAIAYFNVALESKALRAVDTDLRILKPIFSKYRVVFEKFDCPTMSAKSRILFIRKMFSENKFHKITKNLLSVLAEYGALSMFGEVIDAYLELYLKFQKELAIKVISIEKLKNDDINRIKNFFHKKFNRNITIENTLDKSILGGLVIKTNSFVLDGSVANRLKSLEFTLKNELR